MTDSFTTTVDEFVVDTEEKMLAVLRTAIQSTVQEAQTTRDEGGKMPFLTGFLRSSGAAAVNQIPSGPTKGETTVTYSWNGTPLVSALAQLSLNDTFVFGWTAVYANVQNIRYGYLDAALQNWQINVDKAVSKIADN